MDDVNAVRRHTLVEHGVSTAEPGGPAGEWSSVTGPAGQPGWHPDPWNASGLRWWDGAQWSGQTAPIGTSPPGEAPTPTPRSVGRPRPPVQTLVVAGVALVAVVVVAVVALGSRTAGPPKRVLTAPAATLPPVPTTAPAAHALGLAAGVLTPGDVGGGWTVSAAPSKVPQSDYTQGPCGSPLWAHDVAGEQTRLVDGGGGIIQSGEISSQVGEAQSSDAAGAQAAFVTSPSYETCARVQVVAQLESAISGTAVSLGQVSADPLTLNVPMTSVGYAFTIGLVNNALQEGTYLTDDRVELFTGPYEGVLDIISNSLNPLPGNLVQNVTSVLAQRLAALPPGGTLRANAT